MDSPAKFRLVEKADGSVDAEVMTATALGPELCPGEGMLEPSSYLAQLPIQLTNYIDETRRRSYPAVIVQVPRDGRWQQIVARPLDLSARSSERGLVEKLLDQDVRPPRAKERRVAIPPDRPVPFFAARSGVLPRSARPRVSGIPLPKGGQAPLGAPAYWVSHVAASDPELAGRIAKAFPKTGLWPLLWLMDESPDAYMQQPADAELIDTVEVASLLRTGWEYSAAVAPAADVTFGRTPPVLADASLSAPATDVRPFDRLPPNLLARLLLVPCNRPCDAITVIGGLDCEMTGPEISAVLRSWEERFSAMPVAVERGCVWVAIEAPPDHAREALKLVAECNAFCPFPESTALAEVAQAITSKETSDRPPSLELEIRRHLWPVGWYD